MGPLGQLERETLIRTLQIGAPLVGCRSEGLDLALKLAMAVTTASNSGGDYRFNAWW